VFEPRQGCRDVLNQKITKSPDKEEKQNMIFTMQVRLMRYFRYTLTEEMKVHKTVVLRIP
jgi:hypothetical protein